MQKKSTKEIGLMLTSSAISKSFSLLSKIILTSLIGFEAMSIFSLTNPLLVLAITICSFSLPTVLSYLIAKDPLKSKKYVITAFIIVTFNAVILSLILFFFSGYIAIYLLKNEACFNTIRAICVFIPFICISSLVKGFFLGKKQALLTTTSQLFEEGSRFIFNYVFLTYLLTGNASKDAAYVIISMAIGEFFQTLYLLIFCNSTYYKNYKKIFLIKDIEFKNTANEMLKIASFMTGARLIGSITYFLEPIIISNILIKTSINSSEIALNYSLLSTYVMPLLLLPGFFSTTLSNYLLPNLTSQIKQKRLKSARNIFLKISLICLSIGLFFSFCFFFFGKDILNLFYHTTNGAKEIKILSLPFLIYYLESPFITTMNALNKHKLAFISTLISSIMRISLLIILTSHIGVISICIATLISAFVSLTFNGFFIVRELFFNN